MFGGDIEVDIYRKPTKTDAIINNQSRHPKEQKDFYLDYIISS
jgi:hypothetical protein